MQFAYSQKLPAMLAEIEDYLVSKTPGFVQKLQVSGPAYAVFLWYDDSSTAGDLAPDFGVGTESLRLACAQRYDNNKSVNDCIWRPQQVIPEQLLKGTFNDQEFIAKCNDAYALILAANQTGLPLEDEGELLWPFRVMMHGVAARLNRLVWSSLLKTVDDFVVVSVDRMGHWFNEDLRKSIPKAKLLSLQRRGLLCR